MVLSSQQEQAIQEKKKSQEELIKKSQCNNKYDLYRLKSALDECLVQYLEESYQAKEDHRFSNLRIVLGITCLISLLLSHFNPLPWPEQYWLVAGCVCVYGVASYGLAWHEKYFMMDSILLFKTGKCPTNHAMEGRLIRVSTKVTNHVNAYEFSIVDYNQQNQKYNETLMFNHYFDEEGYLHPEEFKLKIEQMLLGFNRVLRAKTD